MGRNQDPIRREPRAVMTTGTWQYDLPGRKYLYDDAQGLLTGMRLGEP